MTRPTHVPDSSMLDDQIVDALPDATLVLDALGGVAASNAAFRAWMERHPADRERLRDLLISDRFNAVREEAAHTATSRRLPWSPAPDRTVEVSVGALADRTLVQLRDVTSETTARRRLAQLNDLSVRLSEALEPDEVVMVILNAAIPVLGAHRGAVFTFNRRHDKAFLVGSVGFDDTLRARYAVVRLDGSAHLSRIERGETVVTTTLAFAADRDLPARPDDRGDRLVILPLVCEGRVGGALALTFPKGYRLTDDDFSFTLDVTAKCAQAFGRAGLLREARMERERLEALIHVTAQNVWWTGPNGESTQVSRSWEAFTGQAEGTSLGDGWLDAVHPEDREAALQGWRYAVATRTPRDAQFRARRHDGVYRVLRSRAIPIWHEGRVREWVGVDVDVTEQVLAEQQLRTWNAELEKQVEERTREARSALDELHAETDALGAFAEFTALTASVQDVETLTEHALEFLLDCLTHAVNALHFTHADGEWRLERHVGTVHPMVVERYGPGFRLDFADWESRLLEGETLVFDTWPPDQLEIPTEANAAALTPVRVSGRALSIVGVGLCLPPGETWTPRNRAIVQAVGRALSLAAERAERTRHLSEKHAELQSLNAELDAFAQTVSHDLRAPIRHVRGFADLALRALAANRPELAAEKLSVIVGAADRANVMIDALLELARDAQRPLRRRTVDLTTLVDHVRVSLAADTTGRDLRWQLEPLPVVQGDPDLLRQVFANLLGNAVKYTRGRHPAVIRVTTETFDDEVVVRVTDNGAGFDPRYTGRLFQPFQRLHHTSEFEGTGVGLVSVARIVARHGGRVEARGELGEGAVFSVWLPRDRTESVSADPGPA